MDDLIERLCYLLNLPMTSTPEEIKGHLQRLMDSLGTAPATAEAMNQLGTVLNLPGKPWAEIATAAHALCVPGATVPVGEFERVSNELNTLKQIAHTAEVDREVCAARSSGKLAPSMEGWAREYASQNLTGFKAWAANAVALLQPGAVINDPPNPAVNAKIPPNASNPERYEVHAKAKAYQAAHSCTFIEAVKAVSS